MVDNSGGIVYGSICVLPSPPLIGNYGFEPDCSFREREIGEKCGSMQQHLQTQRLTPTDKRPNAPAKRGLPRGAIRCVTRVATTPCGKACRPVGSKALGLGRRTIGFRTAGRRRGREVTSCGRRFCAIRGRTENRQCCRSTERTEDKWRQMTFEEAAVSPTSTPPRYRHWSPWRRTWPDSRS